ncbi:MAG: ATP-binding cassette domain-containing protein [Bacteroidetes bacterium]|nr:ATP-binding cassette domain-containing protein [Bacteroidota bacterium]
MSNTVIQVEHLFKQYRLGLVSSGTLTNDINRWFHRILGKEDPYEKITGVNKRDETTNGEYVWALSDINFEVKEGEVLGIIGRNGAGKSTLLKILSKVTGPTKGSIKVKGRIASLLEVGTGFHPELTGRENVFLNGAILGMSKSEIKSKFDEIVAFSGVERYIDTPVKRYSSGMYVRLAFAVAAHLEPEILIVDEVLAVGDADFQKKCLGKMKDVSSRGRTVLFVSHNMKAVASLCPRSIYMVNGAVEYNGETEKALNIYLNKPDVQTDTLYYTGDAIEDQKDGIRLVNARIVNEAVIKNSDPVQVEVELHFGKKIREFHFNIQLKTISDIHLLQASSASFGTNPDETKKVTFSIPAHLLNESQYKISFNYVLDKSQTIHTIYDKLIFTVIEDYKNHDLNWYGKTPGLLNMKIPSTVI